MKAWLKVVGIVASIAIIGAWAKGCVERDALIERAESAEREAVALGDASVAATRHADSLRIVLDSAISDLADRTREAEAERARADEAVAEAARRARVASRAFNDLARDPTGPRGPCAPTIEALTNAHEQQVGAMQEQIDTLTTVAERLRGDYNDAILLLQQARATLTEERIARTALLTENDALKKAVAEWKNAANPPWYAFDIKEDALKVAAGFGLALILR